MIDEPDLPAGLYERLITESLKDRLARSGPDAWVFVNRLNELVLGKRGITADTALRLSRCFSTTPRFWMHLQADWDLHEAVRRGSAA